MSFSSEIKEELKALKMWNINSNMKQDEQIARLSIREDFIKSGSVSDPNKKYHLQIIYKKRKKAEEIISILTHFGITARLIKKDKDYMLYIKDGEEISEFLALIGAQKAVIKFEEIRVIKEKRNDINRLVNCETANLNKTINASVNQIENIQLIKEKGAFHNLPENLKEVAQIRLDNPELSLIEIGKVLRKPIGKSGVNHRMKKIQEIANNLKE